MRKLWAWGFSMAVAAGSCAAASYGGEDVEQAAPARPGIRWSPYAAKALGIDQSKRPPQKPKAKSKKEVAKQTEDRVKDAAPKEAAPSKDAAASARSPEEAALFRRLEACDKLTEIAISNNDNTLLRRAEELNQRVWAAFNQNSGPEKDRKGEFESDEAAIERLLGPEPKDAGAVRPSAREPRKDTRAAAKEVNP